MKVELNKKDFIALVKGSSPNYHLFDNQLVKQSGSYVGGFHDKWDWDESNLNKLTEEQLWKLYVMCRDSWN